MPAKPLARVTSPEALDRATGPRAKLELVVPKAWLAEGCALEVTAPKLLCCARCDGGGCDSCGRGGALRAPPRRAQRALQLSLPGDHTTAVQLRLVDPFADSEIEQLLVQVRPGTTTTPGVTRIEPALQLTPSPAAAWVKPLLRVALVLLAIVLLVMALTY